MGGALPWGAPWRGPGSTACSVSVKSKPSVQPLRLRSLLTAAGAAIPA